MVSSVARSFVLAGHLAIRASHEIAWHERNEHGAFGQARARPGPAFATPLCMVTLKEYMKTEWESELNGVILAPSFGKAN